MSFEQIVAKVKGKAESAAMEGTSVYQFRLSGDSAGDFYINIVDGSAELKEGLAEEPSVSISMKDEDFIAMMEGKLGATAAFFAGKIKIKGDMSLAMKLQTLLG